ncbi:ATP-dependent sacrificial sulfur transferase LarE [Anthocerotibacter panamensis]|uniref:ATP-dependent sacrificial sulfur transferase LarE n=1 Tax=Anthocerotibacter panamensis TaxID=2857077 RepID=UPI001C40256B|nr:ATP-dependent sacrificial sulfur transferase LarE [Anthocerotibacter panamensis]
MVIPLKLQRLQDLLRELDRCVVAYSGGVDSTLVAKVAFDILGERALAVTAASPSLMQEDLDDARTQAAFIGIPHEVVETHELANPNYSNNPVNRCYFCKSELHDTLIPFARERGITAVLDGANLDDLGDYRPGFQAARERGIRSPLIECQIAKLDVRQLSEYLGLPWWNKPAMPCLSSRFPYGEEITLTKLQRLAQAERYLRQAGWRDFRVRSDRDTARIEVQPEQIGAFVQTVDLPNLVERFKSFGYTYVTLDLEGYRQGKLNQVLDPHQLQRFGAVS